MVSSTTAPHPLHFLLLGNLLAVQVTVLASLGLVAALANSYEPPEEAKPTLRKHMTSVRPQTGESANIAARNSKGKPVEG